MATDLIPNSLHERNTLTAISPLFATRRVLIGLCGFVEQNLVWIRANDKLLGEANRNIILLHI